ncbi:MAG: single-stranded-DNA-specific exonuclease RecJ, partial [Bacteroidota bacterium]|nr:single-stranded-DNA-specific exonuclease RecJ [Bacteroidota bacterium]MDX5430422.1 single-stranded-DNA-specific exonuclease RecJ [Bacteroidota bacterium]MDX5469181.1 single-stranded-DNA-specific exonuclease RecJ [Bacteroidota bacterium]
GMEKRWVAKAIPEENIIRELTESIKVSESLAILLAQRGVKDFDSAREYFRPDLKHLHDPFLMKDMDLAVGRIQAAIQTGQKILIYGDYDVDGTTAVTLLYSFLSALHPFCEYYIPDRNKEGYGVSARGIDYARENDFKLIISLDCGVKSIELIGKAKSYGIDFIVCDHHNPGEVLPPAVAVLDAKRSDCPYPYKELSGCGVGFKLAQALCLSMGLAEEKVFDYLDVLAVSIACDIVDMSGENRILAFWGIQQLNTRPRVGLKVLLEKAFERNPKTAYDISDVVFYVGPRINAAGRLDHAYGAVNLLLEQDLEKAREFAGSLHQTNEARKEFELETTREAIAQCEADPQFSDRRSTVVFGENWNKGVIGIVASRLVETFYRPTIVLCKSGDKISGSARSVNGFDIHSAIEACEQHLVQFGGHTHAAGLVLRPEQVNGFKEAFDQVVKGRISEESLVPVITYD